MREVFELLKVARLLLSDKVLPPEGRRKSWKIIRDDGSAYYSPNKPGGANGVGDEDKVEKGGASENEVNDIRDALKGLGGKLPKGIDSIIREEIKKVQQGQPSGAEKPKSLFTEEEQKLPEDVNQPNVDSEESLYKSAAEAQEQMYDILDRDKGLDKQMGMTHFNIAKGDTPDMDVEGPILITVPMKGKARATEKVESDYGGDWSRLQDAVRASIAVDTYDRWNP